MAPLRQITGQFSGEASVQNEEIVMIVLASATDRFSGADRRNSIAVTAKKTHSPERFVQQQGSGFSRKAHTLMGHLPDGRTHSVRPSLCLGITSNCTFLHLSLDAPHNLLGQSRVSFDRPATWW